MYKKIVYRQKICIGTCLICISIGILLKKYLNILVGIWYRLKGNNKDSSNLFSKTRP